MLQECNVCGSVASIWYVQVQGHGYWSRALLCVVYSGTGSVVRGHDPADSTTHGRHHPTGGSTHGRRDPTNGVRHGGAYAGVAFSLRRYEIFR